LAAAACEAGPALVYAAAILLFVCAGVLRWAFRRYPEAVHQLADQTRVLLAANPEHQVTSSGAAEIGELATVINQLAEGYRGLQRDLEAKSADARAHVEEERNRLCGADVGTVRGRRGVQCRRPHSPVQHARGEPGRQRGPEQAQRDYALLGLGRSVFGLLDRDQVAHALDKIQQQLERNVERPTRVS